jgi:hypothetical protein
VGELTIAVLIAERAKCMGVPLGFVEHARSGVPIAILSIRFAAFRLGLTRTPRLLPGG